MPESSGASRSTATNPRAFWALGALGGVCATLLGAGAGCRAATPPRRDGSAAYASASPRAPASAKVPAAASASSSALAASAPAQPTPLSFEGGPHAVVSSAGLVVAVEARAAAIGANVLKQGGNAVDAAIATVFALAVTHPSAASLGGGGFALVRAAGEATLAFDFRETAPSALTRKRFDQMQLAGARGKAAVGVPGLVQGLATLASRAGTRPLGDLLPPAIELAAKGFALPRWEAELLRQSTRHLKDDPTLRRTYFADGEAPKAGNVVRQPELAWTLEKVRTASADGFYRGDVAERLVKALAPDGPTLDDLASYRCIERTPLSVTYRGYTLETMPPPSAGGVALVGTLLMLGQSANAAPSSSASIHYLLEAERRAQAERRLGVLDPDRLELAERVKRLERWQSPNFWLSVPIVERATPSNELRPATQEPEHEAEHTTHVSVVDANGMVVSLTTTLSASFGAKIAAAGTGVVLNNAVASFSATGDNQPLPRARTTSSMAPSLLLAGTRVVAVLGTPGGDTIPSTLAQIVSHLVDERLSLEAAIEAPRWHQAFLPDEARYEPALAASPFLKELSARGHQLRRLSRRFGDANCIVLDGDKAYGYADSREPGAAISGGR